MVRPYPQPLDAHILTQGTCMGPSNLDSNSGGGEPIREAEGRWLRNSLLVGHGEDAVPAGGRLVEEIVLAALPVGARWAIIGPSVENRLESFLRFFPLTLPVEVMGALEDFKARAHLIGSAVDAGLAGAADELVDDNRLQLAFDADQVPRATHKAVGPNRGVSRFIDQNMSPVVFVEAFEARGQIHSIPEGGVAVAQYRAHVADAGHAGVQTDADVEARLPLGFPLLLHFVDAVHHF